MSSLRERLDADVRTALKGGDKPRVSALRLVLAEVKQKELDERITLDGDQLLALLDKLARQRQDSIEQYEGAGREDLAAKERFELEVIRGYLPEPLTEAEIDALIEQALGATGAAQMKDMGKVMGWLKPRLQARADMGAVSARVKQRLGARG